MIFLITDYNSICYVCVKEMSPGGVSFMRPKLVFDRKKLIIIILGSYIFLYRAPYNSK